jgi:RHS repeat-associated protein
VRLPDGSYRPGATIYSRLTERSGGGYTLSGKDGSRIEFDGEGRLESLSDADGNRTALAYNGAGELTQVTDPVGRQITLSYDNERLSRVTDPLGGAHQYGYDGSGRLSSYTDPLLQVTQYSYEPDGRLASITDSEGQTYVSCFYDELGRVSTQTNGLGGQVAFGYGGDRTVVTDANGARTVYHYDGEKRLIALENALGQRRSMTYDAKGNPLTMTDERGNTTRFTYDAHGNLTSVTNPLGQTTTYQYDSADNPTQVTDPLGHAWSFQYDARHRLTRTTDPLGHTTQYAYSGSGQVTRATDANGHATTLSYDAAGNLERVTMPLGQSKTMAYDALGRVTRATDPLGNATQYEYDAVGHLTRVTDPAGGVTRAEYDGNGLLARVIDPLGNSTRYQYDAQLNLTSVTDPLGRVQRFTYDAVGNLDQRTKADGQRISYQYDDAGRLVRVDYADGSHADYDYDAAGNVMRLAHGSWEEQRSYDAAGRLIGVSYPAANVTLAHQLDAAGRRTRLTISRGWTALLQWSYGHDDANRPQTIEDVANGETTRLQYDAASNLTAMIHPSAARTDYTYNANGGLTRSQALDGTGSSVARWDYTYDAAGNPTRVVETRSGGSYTLNYAYDVKGQLTREGHPRYDVTYRYDAAGNRTQMAAPWGTVDYIYDAASQLLSAGSRTFSYDANGNLTQESGAGRTVAYTWDVEDRLTSLTLTGGAELSLEYDALGRPIREVLGNRSQYRLYDGPQIVLDSEDAFQSGAAYPSLGGRLIARWPFGASGVQAVGYHSDGRGSIRLLSDVSGAARDVYTHDAFGYPQGAVGTDANPYRFVGEWGVRALPAPAGLYQMGYRLYDASSGRFLSRDPLLGGLGTPFTSNPYVYALNSPLHYLDPSGLRPIGEIRAERATKRLTGAIVAWAAAPGRQGFDPVEYALRLTFYRQAAQQRIRELQQRLLQIGRREVPSMEGGPGYVRPELQPRLRLTESIRVLQKVMDSIDDILGGQIWR